MSCKLVITVDTEEEGLWGGRYPAQGNTVENIEQVPLFQSICDRWGVRPTYLVDAPVVQSPRAVRILRKIADDGRCEIGTHVHPWCTPPTGEFTDARQSFLCNLPESTQRAKIEWMTDAIEQEFGRRPTSFRAGRYGLDEVGAQILIDLGYTVDSSVIPFTDYSAEGGPDYRRHLWRPYRTNGDLRYQRVEGELLEAPVAVGFNWRNFHRAQLLQDSLRQPQWRRLRLEGLLDRTGVLQRIKLSPEQSNAPRMLRLIKRLKEQGSEAIVMMFHSSSLLPGASPYVRSPADLARFLERIDVVCRECVEQQQTTCCPLSELADVGRLARSSDHARRNRSSQELRIACQTTT